MKTSGTLSLETVLPEGQLAGRAWLEKQGYAAPRIDAALRSRKLEAVAHGVYRRPGPPLKWQNVVYSLNQMGITVHVGGYSALGAAGMAHYLELSGNSRIDLYGLTKVPAWLKTFSSSTWQKPYLDSPPQTFTLAFYTRPRFHQLPNAAVTTRPFGMWDWPIPTATPELAYLELLESVREAGDFDFVDKHFEFAGRLRPDLLNGILAACKSVKTKRLLFWFGKRHAHPWYSQLDRNRADLGSGKRLLVKGGALDKDYGITVPREMAHGAQESVF